MSGGNVGGAPAAPGARLAFLKLAGLLVVAGLALRLVHWGLPLPVHHYGGGFLWGAMVYALVAAAAGTRWRRMACFFVALGIIVAVEGFRLVHAPALDAFRLTLVGQLLLGRVFSAPNMLVDGIGAAMITVVTARWLSEPQRRS